MGLPDWSMSLDPGPQSLNFVPHTGNKKVYVIIVVPPPNVRKAVHHSVGFYFSIFWDVAMPIYTKLYYISIRIIIRNEIVILSKNNNNVKNDNHDNDNN